VRRREFITLALPLAARARAIPAAGDFHDMASASMMRMSRGSAKMGCGIGRIAR
jgi:hypothetical protein